MTKPKQQPTDDRGDIVRLTVAVNDLEEQIAELTAAVEYLAGRLGVGDGEIDDDWFEQLISATIEAALEDDDPQPLEDEEAPQDESEPDESGGEYMPDARARVASWLTAEGFDVEHLQITNTQGTITIETEYEFDNDQPLWRDFTSQYFFDDEAPGSVDWRDVESSDKSYPVFELDHGKINEVIG